MASIGNSVTTQGFIPAVDYFNGNGSTVAFTLSRPVASVAQVQAVIDNVPQNPSSAYTVSGNTITFTSAPLSGTNNIYVQYTSPITQVFQPSQGTVGTTQIADGVTINFNDGSAAAPSITNSGDTNTGMFFPAADTIAFAEGGVEAMRIDSSGNVGIGTSSPSYKLSVNGTIASLSSGINAYGLTNSDTISNQMYMQNSAGNKAANFQIGTTGILQTWVYGGSSWVNATTIDSSGYVTKPYQVAFTAYNASGTAANPTIFASTTLNIGSAYNTSTGRFTAPIAGRYLICTNIHSGNAAGGTADFRLQKNGSVIEGGGACRSVSYYAQGTGVVVVQLAAGDYLTILTYTNFSNTLELTYFSGYLLG